MDRAFEIQELLQHAGWLRGLAASLVSDRGRADDLVQDTWLAALRHPPLAGVSPRPWLGRVFRNLARNQRRDERTRGTHEAHAEPARSSPSPDAIAAEVEAQRLLAEAVGRLADPGRTIVVLRYFRGLDSAAIGRELGLPAGTVRWRLQAALEELRRELDRRFEGGRKAWSLALLRVLAVSSPAAAAVPYAWIGLAAAAAALLGFAGWRGRRDAPRMETARLVAETTERAAARAALDGIHPAAEATSERGEPRGSTARVPLAAPPTPVSRTTGAPDLAGSVLLDGAPPHEVIHLDLVLDGAESRQLVTDDGGRFAVFAIGEGVSVSLSAPGYVVDDEASSSWWPLQVFTPRDDVVLRLLTPPAIRGRVVTARGEPVPRAHGSYALTATAGGWELIPGRGELDCDEEGRFALPLLDVMATGDPKLGEGETCSGSLLFEVPRVGRRLLETGPFPPRDLALGDVVLEAVRTLRFVVRDERGAALAGAVARLDDHWLAKPSSPTNREGRSELRTMLERTATVRFSALGYADRVLVLEPGDAADVWLEPVTLLEVQLEPPANTYGAFPLVVLVAHDPLFAWTDAPHPESGIDIDPIQTELGASMSYSHGYTKGPEGYFETTHWQPDAGGHALIVGIRPGLSFRLEARNEAGTVLATRELMLSPGERRRLTLPFGEPP